MTEAFNEDCMIGMARYSDKYFDLAIVDPPYGININNNIGRRKGDKPSDYKKIEWDNMPPDEKYFWELIRVSKDQIIWGANHFLDRMPFNLDSPCWLLWDKGFSEELSFAQFELAWTSFKSSAKKYEKTSSQKNRIHPTQKPVDLYGWILNNYAKQGDKILDTHLGSGSSRIAADELGFDFTGFELDKDYFNDHEKRFNEYKSQLKMFPA